MICFEYGTDKGTIGALKDQYLAHVLLGCAGASTAALTTAGVMLNAGFSALASQAAISLVNNKGDAGKTLNDLSKEETVRNIAASVVTAGALNELGNSALFSGQSGAGSLANSTSGVTTAQASNSFTSNLLKNVTNNLAGTVINSTITGEPLNEDILASALTSAFITTGMAQAANSIGEAAKNGTLNAYTQAVAHALAGCVGGAATTGHSGGCSAGAVGAVVGELTMNFATDNQLSGKEALKLATSMSAIAGALVGGSNDASAVNVASQMGTNAALNNFCKGQANCVNRRFTFNDAVDHWRNGSGTPIMDVDANELNIKDATFKKISEGVYLVHTSLKYDTGAIYGTVTGFLNPDGTMSFKPDTYNFDLKGYSDVNSMAGALARTQRNVLTGLGVLVNGVGDSYNIYFKGSISAPANLPK